MSNETYNVSKETYYSSDEMPLYTHTHTNTHAHTHKHTHKHRERERERDTQIHTHTHTHRICGSTRWGDGALCAVKSDLPYVKRDLL